MFNHVSGAQDAEREEVDWKVRLHKDRGGKGMFTAVVVKAKTAEEAKSLLSILKMPFII